MTRWFNTAGPCKGDLHYLLPTERRMPELRALIDQQTYFVLHAPRQVGKTTSLMSLAATLTAEGRYASVLVSVEVGAPYSVRDPGAAELAMLGSWRRAAEAVLPRELLPPPWPEANEGERLGAALQAWCTAIPRPLVLFIDEIDAVYDDALISVLRQLRDGYRNRPQGFPWSLALIGLRDVRDYKVSTGVEGRLGTSSPFNIKVESLTLRDFRRDEVAELYAQHTDETGQRFEVDAIDRAFELTQGQPWLVNALARQLTEKLVTDRSIAITCADVDRARDVLIARNDTHLDSLAERLREPRVRHIVEPILAGLTLGDVPEDDVRFCKDLGLLRQTDAGGLVIANPIYAEVIPRTLSYVPRASLPQIAPSWLRPDGSLDGDKLLSAFVAFWRKHGQPLMGSAPYHEIAPHLVLLAFLDRVANGGGRVEREYAIGSGRMDVLLMYGDARVAMELKVWRDGRPDPLAEGLEQLEAYLAGLGLDEGWLVLFDRRSGLPHLEERVRVEEARTESGRRVRVVRG
ncbi:MAG: ATP-binding protein [Deltaproteobacteria bacterium]|nr:ATP-binding protein [Deltaproteobacteria bacterium]